MISDQEFTDIYLRQIKTVYGIALCHGLQAADCEDIAHNTFLCLLESGTVFKNAKHEKGWCIVTASNLCIDLLRSKQFGQSEIREDDAVTHLEMTDQTLYRAVVSLPLRLRMPVHLFYYEGYKSREIARLLQRKDSTIRSQFAEARALLKEQLESKGYEY